MKAKELALTHALTISLGFLTAVFTTIAKTNTLAERVSGNESRMERIEKSLDHISDRVDRIYERQK